MNAIPFCLASTSRLFHFLFLSPSLAEYSSTIDDRNILIIQSYRRPQVPTKSAENATSSLESVGSMGSVNAGDNLAACPLATAARTAHRDSARPRCRCRCKEHHVPTPARELHAIVQPSLRRSSTSSTASSTANPRSRGWPEARGARLVQVQREPHGAVRADRLGLGKYEGRCGGGHT